ncbi:unnamed protein product [Vicia faba]|uniref:Uncharacterized protein n=1 Tax=Vicia faba TaxID=3906 RepID=A0AAV1ADZ1_VICFA|nr:unnamed protein product [Vicia faba]
MLPGSSNRDRLSAKASVTARGRGRKNLGRGRSSLVIVNEGSGSFSELTGLTKLFDALRVSVCSSQSLFGSLLQHGSLLEPCTFIEIFFRMGVAFFHPRDKKGKRMKAIESKPIESATAGTELGSDLSSSGSALVANERLSGEELTFFLADSISPESALGSKPAAKSLFYDTLESGVHGRLNRQRPVPHSQHPLQSRAISPLARRSSFRSSSTTSSLDVQSVRTDMTLHVIIMGTSSSLVSSGPDRYPSAGLELCHQ